MKTFFQNKKAGVYFNLAAAIFAVVTLIAYAVAGQDSYGFVPMVDVLLGLGVVSALVFSWRDFGGFGPVVTMALFGGSFGMFLNSRFMYFSHQYYGIASAPITTSMVITTAGFVGLLLLELISGFMCWEGKR